MERYGLLGHPLGHSFSKEIHESITDYTYELIDLDLENFHKFMEKRDFSAVNVTIPYKQEVIPYLDHIDPMAKTIGAVNTVVNRGGSLWGYNTDAVGLKDLILRNTDSLTGKTVLILGSGGTSKTARYVAADLGAEKIYIASRHENNEDSRFITYDEIEKIADSVDVLINTTPLGMYPNPEGKAADVKVFKNLGCVIDVVYNPLRTKLVLEAKEMGIPAEGGLYMLVSQAVKAIEHFRDCEISDDVKEKAFKNVLKKRQNIVFTGMPGSGKTVIGKLVAERLGMKFCDTDEVIESRYAHPSVIIREKGEAEFRDIESTVTAEIAMENGCVISTGGGAILRQENIRNLKMNGKIFFIDRALEDILPSEDRPLSSTREQLIQVYNDRIDIYRSTCDMVINADCGPDAASDKVIMEMSL